jgi:hypothetical protein
VKVGGSISSEDLLASRSAGVHGEVLAVTDEMVWCTRVNDPEAGELGGCSEEGRTVGEQAPERGLIHPSDVGMLRVGSRSAASSTTILTVVARDAMFLEAAGDLMAGRLAEGTEVVTLERAVGLHVSSLSASVTFADGTSSGGDEGSLKVAIVRVHRDHVPPNKGDRSTTATARTIAMSLGLLAEATLEVATITWGTMGFHGNGLSRNRGLVVVVGVEGCSSGATRVTLFEDE